jgi:hypothetical protein
MTSACPECGYWAQGHTFIARVFHFVCRRGHVWTP